MASIWAGWLLEPDEPILLVLDDDSKIDEVVKLFLRTGYTKFAGYLAGGMKAWDNAGFELEEVGQMTVHEVKDAGSRLQIVDVRSPSRMGERPHARARITCSCPSCAKRSANSIRTKPTAVYCDSGYRASIGTSILKQEGFKCVCNIPGSWQAWKKAKFPIEGGDGK